MSPLNIVCAVSPVSAARGWDEPVSHFRPKGFFLKLLIEENSRPSATAVVITPLPWLNQNHATFLNRALKRKIQQCFLQTKRRVAAEALLRGQPALARSGHRPFEFLARAARVRRAWEREVLSTREKVS